MSTSNNYMQAVKSHLERQGRIKNPLYNYWIEIHLNAVKNFTNQFSFIKRYLKKSSEIRCLELGCGTGPASIGLALEGNSVVGLDCKREGLGLNLGKIRANDHDVTIDFMQGTGATLSFKDNIFDFLYCNQVIEHVEKKDEFL